MSIVLKRLDFNKFVEADFTYMRFAHVAKQESQLGMRERIDREMAVMIDDLMSINLEYNNVGKQVLAIWQGYWMAISALDIDVED
ncbi:hypothetical protein [Desulfitobacterium chlororespirans]|uniref:hypothetical protein n=1 Tax=Desulfitobacterium chlororespirans TaxID=51616 RepID=UPI001FA851B5|nr:hypothetical protein [Desulfitobacterium chlororespirans]